MTVVGMCGPEVPWNSGWAVWRVACLTSSKSMYSFHDLHNGNNKRVKRLLCFVLYCGDRSGT